MANAWLVRVTIERQNSIEAQTGMWSGRLTGYTDNVTSVAFSPNNATLATGGLDETVRLWNVTNGDLLFSLAHRSDVYAVTFAANGQTLASGGWGNTIRLWNPQTGLPNESLFGHTGTVLTLAFAPDNKTLASAKLVPRIRHQALARTQRRATTQSHKSFGCDLRTTLHSG